MLEANLLTLKSKIPFYDGLLPVEGHRTVTKRNMLRRSLELFIQVWKRILGKQNSHEIILKNESVNTIERRKSTLSASSFRPLAGKPISRKIRVTLH